MIIRVACSLIYLVLVSLSQGKQEMIYSIESVLYKCTWQHEVVLFGPFFLSSHWLLF